ncbi:MAG: TraL conjugative transposon family protein [Mangrovibacterium sp.]|nr:TraL conjugative transposon family protein [Mangrovibacterium sp.]|tara:strand:- start:981 stop:1238 length:258 start_codon:yes stop_codon:yes gene_type:complete
MKQKVSKTGRLLDDTLRKACERIPVKKRKLVVLGLCFLFVTVFSIMLWSSFNNPAAQKILNIEHIKPLDLPQDSLIQNFKDVFHE